ncbi:hypothetical protein LPB140_03750 [Sphingorhabdus lutea]|uniref:M23ase beta-sheet core domain-containing protein n=1 Tax=Sphingorhabdus lutea TaxID=1913578 RepID=A0A1L3JAB3_9SPHN|nr:M23 family metallopeptidase [Sphingorhabdus lutea]APG62072.1 hypothetical protein LPB140_03750 [Sphingorhabdus lutea]
MLDMMWGAKNITLMMSAAMMSCTAIPYAGSSGAVNMDMPAAHHDIATSAHVDAPAQYDEMDKEIALRPDFWFSATPQQGAVLRGRAPSNTVSLQFNGENIPLNQNGLFLIGFDRDAPENSQLVATLSNGNQVAANLTVQPTNWQLERVNTAYYGGARSSEAFQKIRGDEIGQINAARSISSDSEGWKQDFIWPVKGRLSGLFGRQRIYQGKPGSYHSGMDIAVPTGTEYVAPADGVVILASETDFSLEGKLLMIDHGNGLNSAFLHSSELLVKTGDVVKQGQIIGRVGATGRASGPHLHWGMKWNAARVDPKLLLPSE